MIRIDFGVIMTIVADMLYKLLADEIIIKMKKKATTPIFKSNKILEIVSNIMVR